MRKSDKMHRKSNKMLNKSILSTSLIFLIFLIQFNEIPEIYTDSNFVSTILINNIICTFSFFFLRIEPFSRLKTQYLRFSYFFIFSLVIVHFQAFFDLSLGYLDHSNYSLWIDSKVINKSVVIASIGLVSFYLGYSVFNTSRIRYAFKGEREIDLNLIKILNLLFLILFLSQIDSTFLDSSLYGGGRRNSSLILGISMLLFETSMVAIIVLIVHNNLIKRHIRSFDLFDYVKHLNYSILSFFIYVPLVLMSGDRGPAIYLILSLVIGYVIISKMKVPILVVISSIILGAFFVSMLGFLRSSDMSFKEMLTFSEYNRIYPQSVLPQTKELAGSILPLQIAVENIPSNYQHTKGLFLFQNTSVLVPGLNSYLNEFFDIPANYFTSARFLTFLYLGPSATWGIGTSCIADTYIDFGHFGVLIVFVLFGYFARSLEVNTFVYNDPKLLSIALHILFFSFSIYIARSNLVVPFTKLVYVLIFCYASKMFSKTY